jgi:drug/metabolite transporter (DMT)-like permease
LTARAWLLLAGCSALWGLPYLLIKICVDGGVPATGIVLARSLIGAACLVPFVSLKSLRGRWRAIFVLAALDMAIPFLLLSEGEKDVASSLAGILVATVPLLIALLALRFDHEERVTGSRLVGLFVGIAGVALLLGLEVSGSALWGAVLVLLAALAYAAATLYLKHSLSGVPALPLVAGTMLATVAMLAVPGALQAGDWPRVEGDVAIALLGLGILCSAAAYVAYYALIALVGPSRASLNTYISPAIAAVLGVVVLDETLGAGAIAGLALVLCGSWLSARS